MPPRWVTRLSTQGRPAVFWTPSTSAIAGATSEASAERREPDEEDAVPEWVEKAFGCSKREAGLPGAAGAGEGDDAHTIRGEELLNRLELLLATDECLDIGGEVVRSPAGGA